MTLYFPALKSKRDANSVPAEQRATLSTAGDGLKLRPFGRPKGMRIPRRQTATAFSGNAGDGSEFLVPSGQPAGQ